MSPYVSPNGINFVRKKLSNFPRPDKFAAGAVQKWAKTQGVELNPDKVEAAVLHYQRLTHGRAQGVVARKMTLTQALLSNWQGESDNNLIDAALHHPWAGQDPGTVNIVKKLDPPGFFENNAGYQIYNGLYRQTFPQVYGPQTHVKLPAEAFQRFIWDLDFHAPYKKMLDNFWRDGLKDYQTCAKINFIAATNKQISDGSLTEAGKRLAWQLAGVETHPTWESLGHAPRSGAVVQASPLNIYGYAATDILCLKNNATGLTVLYIPGNSSPLHEFADEAAMKTWIAEQCKAPLKLQALMQHFSPADRADGVSYSGLETALNGLGKYPHAYVVAISGGTDVQHWNPQEYVNYNAPKYSPPILGDLFLDLAQRQKTRSYQDADFIITTDGSVTKAKWRGYVNSTINMLAPLALIVPELAPIFAIGGIVQFGLGLDQTLNGKTREDKIQGIENQVFGLLNAAPLLHAQLTEKPAIFQIKSDRFVKPLLINGQIGYPLSPLSPPHLPEESLASFFRIRNAIEPIDGGSRAVSTAIARVPRYDARGDSLQGLIGGSLTEVRYNPVNNTFIRTRDIENPEIKYFIPSGTKQLLRLEQIDRVATDAERTSTLRALGVDLTLPVDFSVRGNQETTIIPKKISGLWVGDKIIGEDYLRAIEHNATLLGGTEYEYRLFISNSTPTAYTRNLEILKGRAPTLTVLPLEEQGFYKAFSESEYFQQYKAALDGNGGVATNYASASDILRYPMLRHDGGFYMDLDDTLLPAESSGAPTAAISQIELKTTCDGLLLHPAVSQEILGMNIKYNTSMIGSHPSNPTLDAISEEIHLRYQSELDFYNSKPLITDDRAGFYKYAATLNRLTGPGVLNDVIDRTLPDLKLLREIDNFLACPNVNSGTVIDLAAYSAAKRVRVPCDRFAQIGHSNSWKLT